MSRSEHGNARDRTDPRDRARKRQIKRLIVSERRHLDTDMPVVSSDAIPIITIDRDRDSCVWLPSIADLRGVMARLPDGCLNGLARIELARSPVDHEIAPGVRAPSTLGQYSPRDAIVKLYAYVRDRDVPAHIRPYLRLHALGTFVHEIGHHQDFMARETRGRWRVREDAVEPNAEAREDAWVTTCVVPYLEATYPGELAELRHRQTSAFGTVIPLELLARGSVRMFATRDLLGMLADSAPTIEQQRHVAFWVHYDDHFDVALAILDHALAGVPDDVEAITDRAHVLNHLGRDAEAAAISRAVLAREPANLASLFLLRGQAIDAHDWAAIVELSTTLLAIQTKSSHRFISFDRRMRASIELTDWAAAQRDLDELRELAATPEDQHRVTALACLWLVRRGCDDDAVKLATADRETMIAVAEYLRGSGDVAWADRLGC